MARCPGAGRGRTTESVVGQRSLCDESRRCRNGGRPATVGLRAKTAVLWTSERNGEPKQCDCSGLNRTDRWRRNHELHPDLDEQHESRKLHDLSIGH